MTINQMDSNSDSDSLTDSLEESSDHFSTEPECLVHPTSLQEPIPQIQVQQPPQSEYPVKTNSFNKKQQALPDHQPQFQLQLPQYTQQLPQMLQIPAYPLIQPPLSLNQKLSKTQPLKPTSSDKSKDTSRSNSFNSTNSLATSTSNNSSNSNKSNSNNDSNCNNVNKDNANDDQMTWDSTEPPPVPVDPVYINNNPNHDSSDTVRPDFSKMTLQELKNEVSKYGLRTAARDTMILRLNKIWDAKLGISSPKTDGARILQSGKYIYRPNSFNSTNLQPPTSTTISTTALSTTTSTSTANTEETELTKKICAFLKKKENEEFYSNLLHYNAINLQELHDLLTKNEIKTSRAYLKTFLNEQGIEFTK